MAKRTAVIDIGSNSVRMVIFEKSSRFAFHLLHETKSRVRISEGAYANHGNLQDVSIARTLRALGEFLNIAASYRVRKTLCVATSAVRDAPNRPDFIRQVRQQLNLSVKVIDGEKEAYLGGVACANLLPAVNAHTIDIGGGSSECACLQERRVVHSASLDLGTVRLKEMFFDHHDIEGAKACIDSALQGIPSGEAQTVIGVGGTFRALAQIIMKASDHPVQKLHAFTFKTKTLLALGEAILQAKNNSELKALGVKKERYDVIRPGTLILMRFLKHVGCHTLITSGAGVREGVYLSDLLRHNDHRFPHGFNPSLRYLLDRHTLEPKFSSQMQRVALNLYDLLETHEDAQENAYRRSLLSTAAKLTKVGASVHFYSYQKYSQYLVESALEYGYTHEEIMSVSALVRYHKKRKISKVFLSKYGDVLPDHALLNRLTLILAIADALLAHRPRSIDFVLASTGKDTLTIRSGKPESLYLARELLDGIGADKALKIEFATTEIAR